LLHVANGHDDEVLKKLQSLIPPPRRSALLAQVVVGRPAAAIVHTARAVHAQLLVIGAGRRSPLGGRLFGETGQLLRDATCAVLAVPTASAAQTVTEDVQRLAA
jgi:nucleotide-binding universal stress UspA family protein